MKVAFYVQLEPRWNGAGTKVISADAIRVNKQYPSQPARGVVITKITLDIDQAVFEPLEAVGRLDAGVVRIVPLEVEQPESGDRDA